MTASTRRGVIVAALYGWLTACALTGALLGNTIRRSIARHRKEMS